MQNFGCLEHGLGETINIEWRRELPRGGFFRLVAHSLAL